MPLASTPQSRAAAIARRDVAFRQLVKSVGPPPRRRPTPVAQRFPTLARSITFQLLATKAADTIHRRVIDLCDGEVSAASIARAGHARLRATGLTNAKAAAMLDLAQRTLDGSLRFARHGSMSDDEVLTDLVVVRGVGPWTAQMYLMHTLARTDVWPAGDFGVRNGWTLLHGLDKMISEADLRAQGDVFAGLRSDVAWYCWRAVEKSRTQ